MSSLMLQSALFYHRQGLCVIPIKPKDKAPAIPWTQYQTKRSTRTEVEQWFGNGTEYNIGLVHGEVSYNYLTLDIDHDQGIYNLLRQEFPSLFTGAIEQSGSYEGYHIPLRAEQLPNYGNRTWHTKTGDVNIRVRGCQTVVPPSIHPSGRRYHFIQTGRITTIKCVCELMDWLDTQIPKPTKAPIIPSEPLQAPSSDLATKYGNVAIQSALRLVEEAPDGGKHTALLKAARLLGGYVGGGMLKQETCQYILETAIAAKPNVKDFAAASTTIEKGLMNGMTEPITLEDKLREKEEWAAGQQPEPTEPPYWSGKYQRWERLR